MIIIRARWELCLLNLEILFLTSRFFTRQSGSGVDTSVRYLVFLPLSPLQDNNRVGFIFSRLPFTLDPRHQGVKGFSKYSSGLFTHQVGLFRTGSEHQRCPVLSGACRGDNGRMFCVNECSFYLRAIDLLAMLSFLSFMYFIACHIDQNTQSWLEIAL